jgi:hypothetical protein
LIAPGADAATKAFVADACGRGEFLTRERRARVDRSPRGGLCLASGRDGATRCLEFGFQTDELARGGTRGSLERGSRRGQLALRRGQCRPSAFDAIAFGGRRLSLRVPGQYNASTAASVAVVGPSTGPGS